MNEANDSKLVTRKWNIDNDNSKTNCNVGSEIIYNTEVLKSNFCDYNNTCFLGRGDITVKAVPSTKVAFNNCAQFTKCITKIDEKIIDDAENLDLVMQMHNLTEYSSDYSETTESF